MDSFNDFILKKIGQVLEGFNPIKIYQNYNNEKDDFQYTLVLNIKNPVLSKPIIYEKDGSIKPMTPNEQDRETSHILLTCMLM